MRVVIQRVLSSSVKVNEQIVGSINRGLLLLVGFGLDDNQSDLAAMANKIINLRVFPGENANGDFELSAQEVAADLLVVSQFTLYADCRRGRRPSLSAALNPAAASLLYRDFCNLLKSIYPHGMVAQGIFGADMKVSLENDGPITLILESEQKSS